MFLWSQCCCRLCVAVIAVLYWSRSIVVVKVLVRVAILPAAEVTAPRYIMCNQHYLSHLTLNTIIRYDTSFDVSQDNDIHTWSCPCLVTTIEVNLFVRK